MHVQIESSWYGSRFILTSTGTDGSQTYLEHCVNLCKQFGPRPGPTNVERDLDQKLFDTQIVILKEFSAFFFFKKISRLQKICKITWHAKLKLMYYLS